MSNLFQIYVFLIVYPLAWLWTIITCLAIIVLSLLNKVKLAGRYAARYWGKIILWITPVKVIVSGLQHISENQSYVIIANHQSTYDIFAVYGYMPLDFRWVMKQELRKVPFVGFACQRMGHIFVNRFNSQKSIAALKQAEQELVNGTSVFFFPEGTRSNGKSLKPFKKGAFKMAKDLKLPILPLSIANANQVMPSNGYRIYPGTIKMTFHPAINLEKINTLSLSQLQEMAQKQIASAV